MIHRKNTAGFTLVELMLSMAFLSMLLLAIALLVLQISSVYNKGLTLRAVNEAGQLVSSDIQRTLDSASPAAVTHAPDDSVTNPTGGRFCIGTTVYAWNYGKYLTDTGRFNIFQDGRNDPVRLVKFTKDEKDYCQLDGDTYPPLPSSATDILSSGDSNLAIHLFTISEAPVEGDDSQRIYDIRLELGTNETSVIAGNGCTKPASAVDDEYCAVNTFEFTARAGNK